MFDLVIRIEGDDGTPWKMIRVPMEELPSNANTGRPLRLRLTIEGREIELGAMKLPPWHPDYPHLPK